MNNSAQSTAHDTFLTSYLRSRPRWLRALGVPDPAVSAIDLASPPRHLRRTLHGNSRARFLLTADRDAALARLSSTPPPPPRATDPVDEPLPSIDGDAEGERRMFTRYQGLKDRLSRLRNKIPVSWEKFQELDVTQRATRRQVERMEVAYPKYIAHWDAEIERIPTLTKPIRDARIARLTLDRLTAQAQSVLKRESAQWPARSAAIADEDGDDAG